MIGVLLLIVALVVCGAPLLLYLFWCVHCALDQLCVRHARKFCQRNDLHLSRVRWQPQFEPSGIKTEFTLVQMDCLDLDKRRRLVLLSAWPFGVRQLVSDEVYPDSYEEQWPSSHGA